MLIAMKVQEEDEKQGTHNALRSYREPEDTRNINKKAIIWKQENEGDRHRFEKIIRNMDLKDKDEKQRKNTSRS